MKKNLAECLLAGISGVVTALCFSLPQLSLGSFFGLVPLFLATRNVASCKKMFRRVLCYGFFYYVTLMLWLCELAPMVNFENTAASILLIIAALLLIGLFEGGQLALACCFFPKLKRGSALDIFTFAALFTLGEWLQGALPLLPFPWGRLGTALPEFTIFLQSASLLGGLFISFLIVVVNGALSAALTQIKTRGFAPALVVIAAVFALNMGYGALVLLPKSSADKDGKSEVLLIQGNFGGQDKWDAAPPEMLAEYLRLTKKAVTKNTRLAVFPETAIPIDLNKNPTEKQLICDFAREENITILTGVNHFDGDAAYNSMVAISPSGEISEPYSKQKLVPFGESVPFYALLSVFTDSLDPYNVFTAGKSTAPIPTEIGLIGGVICYESIFPSVSRQTVKAGAQILAVISNDSWFGNSPALYQHYAHSVLRAVENGRYLLRASNTAVTAVISPRGEVIAIAKPFIGTAISAEIAQKNGITLYTRFGNLTLLALLGVYLLTIAGKSGNRFPKSTD